MALNGVILHSKRSNNVSSSTTRVNEITARIAKISMVVIDCVNAHMEGYEQSLAQMHK
jgi:triosephosphate isomerase